MLNSYTRIYTFNAKALNNSNSHNHTNSHTYPNSHIFSPYEKKRGQYFIDTIIYVY